MRLSDEEGTKLMIWYKNGTWHRSMVNLLDKQHGIAREIDLDGNIYECTYKRSKLNGLCRFIRADGSYDIQFFENHEFTKTWIRYK